MTFKDVSQLIERSPLLNDVKNNEEVFWKNSMVLPTKEATAQIDYGQAEILDAKERLERFAPFIELSYPETSDLNGIIESPISEIPTMKEYLDDKLNEKVNGRLWLKCDDLLPISGTIKARGAIYEVLKHAETLALEHGFLKNTDEDYSVFASDEMKDFFSQFNITVGTTGNLGISVGTMGRQLGFDVTVHMSVEAKKWKKEYLKNIGVEVIEHDTDFSKAVEKGRAQSEADPKSYFVDDEHSVDLFLGYTVGGFRMKEQMEKAGITVDADHPLFVYLPCGIGGSPGGVTFGLKQAFGDNVHCFFAEPTEMPSMMIGLMTQEYDALSVFDFGLGGSTVADGLAVPRTSGLVAKIMKTFFSGGYTLTDDHFKALLSSLHSNEDIFLEPAAVAGIIGAHRLAQSEEGQSYLQEKELIDKMSQATHLAWGTGGSMVPEADRKEFLADSSQASL